IVIAVLGAADLVPHQDHGGSLRQEYGSDEVAAHLFAQLDDVRVITWTFNPAVPTQIVRMAVIVVFAIRFIVFVVVGNDIIQSETVMRGYEVDAGPRSSPTLFEQVSRPQ